MRKSVTLTKIRPVKQKFHVTHASILIPCTIWIGQILMHTYLWKSEKIKEIYCITKSCYDHVFYAFGKNDRLPPSIFAYSQTTRLILQRQVWLLSVFLSNSLQQTKHQINYRPHHRSCILKWRRDGYDSVIRCITHITPNNQQQRSSNSQLNIPLHVCRASTGKDQAFELLWVRFAPPKPQVEEIDKAI